MKKYSRCKIEKELTEFSLHSVKKQRYKGICKTCDAEMYQEKRDVILAARREKEEAIKNDPEKYAAKLARQNAYYAANKDTILHQRKELHKKPEKSAHVNAQRKRRYEANKSKMLEQQRQYLVRNNEEVNARRRAARKTNPRINEVDRLWRQKRRENDINFRLLEIQRNRIRLAVHAKSNCTRDLIGCDINDYRLHLERQFTPEMSWENYGTYWSIDHIKPCCSFDLEDPIQQAECFNFSNCRPLTIPENSIKGQTSDRIARRQFEESQRAQSENRE